MARVVIGASIYVHGEPRGVGDVVEVDAATAKYLIDTGKATEAPAAPVVIEEVKPAPKRTATTTATKED